LFSCLYRFIFSFYEGKGSKKLGVKSYERLENAFFQLTTLLLLSFFTTFAAQNHFLEKMHSTWTQ